VLFDQFGFIDTGEFLATTLRVHGGHEAVVSATSVHVSEQGYVALTTPGVTTEAVVVAGISTSPSDAEQKILFDFMSDGLIRYAIGESELGQFTGVNGKALAKASSEEESHEGVPGQMLVNARSADDIQRSVMNIGNVPRARRLVVENGSISLEGESPLQAMRKAVSEPLSNKNLTSGRVRQPPQNEPPLAKASAAVVKPVPFNSKQNTVPAPDNKNRSVSADPLPSNYVHNRTPAPAKRAPSSQPQLQRAGQAKGKSPSHGKKAQKASPLTQAHQPQSPPWNSMPSGLPEWIKYLPKSESITDTPAMSRP
jgi:hypothetical protein